MPRFDTAQFLSLVQDYRVTTLFLVPPIVLALAKSPLVVVEADESKMIMVIFDGDGRVIWAQIFDSSVQL